MASHAMPCLDGSNCSVGGVGWDGDRAPADNRQSKPIACPYVLEGAKIAQDID